MKIAITRNNCCRICGSDDVHQFLDFADYPLSDNFLDKPHSEAEFLHNYEAHWCRNCGISQNLANLDWSEYYADYDYHVSTSQFACDFMSKVANKAVSEYDLKTGDCVVEIGSADGYQLKQFAELGFEVTGFEPSEPLVKAALASGVNTVQELFDDSTADLANTLQGKVQVFLSFFTFDHMPDPLACLKTMRQQIDPVRGIVIIEIHDLDEILRRCEACLFCHEHTVYLSAGSLVALLERAQLKLLSTELLPDAERRGNSLLIVAGADTCKYQPDNSALRAANDRTWKNWDRYREFANDVDVRHSALRDYVEKARAEGKTVAGYGASARSISTLSLAGLGNSELEFLCDQNEHLHGKYLPYSGLEICSPSRLEAAEIDETIVFSYGYLSEIVANNSGYTAKGGKFTSLLDLLTRSESELRKAS